MNTSMYCSDMWIDTWNTSCNACSSATLRRSSTCARPKKKEKKEKRRNKEKRPDEEEHEKLDQRSSPVYPRLSSLSLSLSLSLYPPPSLSLFLSSSSYRAVAHVQEREHDWQGLHAESQHLLIDGGIFTCQQVGDDPPNLHQHLDAHILQAKKRLRKRKVLVKVIAAENSIGSSARAHRKRSPPPPLFFFFSFLSFFFYFFILSFLFFFFLFCSFVCSQPARAGRRWPGECRS